MSVISIQDATFSYDGKTEIFSHLTCDIETDQIFCILGPNGIGKSTLLKGIMNLHPLLNGQVQLDGKDIRSYDTKELAKKIAYIPQTYQLVFPYQVLDLILMGRTPHLNSMNRPAKKDYDKVMEAVEALDLGGVLHRPCNQLSGGQLQMVMLARAVAQEADFLLLDEPTSHLDFGKQMETLNLILKMKKRGVGILMTTHNPDHAFLIGDRVAIMNQGTFTSVGKPEEVITEENLHSIYHVPVRIRGFGEDINRKICIPLREEGEIPSTVIERTIHKEKGVEK